MSSNFPPDCPKKESKSEWGEKRRKRSWRTRQKCAGSPRKPRTKTPGVVAGWIRVEEEVGCTELHTSSWTRSGARQEFCIQGEMESRFEFQIVVLPWISNRFAWMASIILVRRRRTTKRKRNRVLPNFACSNWAFCHHKMTPTAPP